MRHDIEHADERVHRSASLEDLAGLDVRLADVDDFRGELILRVGRNEMKLKGAAAAAIQLATTIDDAILDALRDQAQV
jgi:hypothetical protein